LDYPKDNFPISKRAMTSKHDVRFLGRLAIDKITNVTTTNKNYKDLPQGILRARLHDHQ
jgi:hypothetical protein